MDNVQGHAEAYRDVVHEDVVRIGGAVKAAYPVDSGRSRCSVS
jgi:hypothetical protein